MFTSFSRRHARPVLAAAAIAIGGLGLTLSPAAASKLKTYDYKTYNYLVDVNWPDVIDGRSGTTYPRFQPEGLDMTLKVTCKDSGTTYELKGKANSQSGKTLTFDCVENSYISYESWIDVTEPDGGKGHISCLKTAGPSEFYGLKEFRFRFEKIDITSGFPSCTYRVDTRPRK